MSITKSYDRALYKQCVLHMPLFEGVGSGGLLDIAKPHHPFVMNHSPAWTQLASGVWTLTTSGSADYLSCVAAACTDLEFGTGNCSGVLWIKPTQVSTVAYLYNKYKMTAPRNGMSMQTSGSAKFVVEFESASSSNNLTSTTSLTTTAWWLCGFGVSYRPTGRYGAPFINGSPESTLGSALRDMGASGVNALFGKREDGVWFYNGQMAGLRLWNRALSFAEHREIFNRERHLFGV